MYRGGATVLKGVGAYNFASGGSEKLFGPPPFAYLGKMKQNIA